MTMIGISVIMSIYNEPFEWLKASVDSILQQTFTNIEFIIINDNPGRPENKAYLDSIAEKDSRVVVITNQTNIGLTKSLNLGLRAAKGKYIARMDADDISLPERLQVQFDYLEENLDYILCGSDAVLINEKGNRKSEKLRLKFSDRDIRDTFPLFNPIVHPAIFFRTEVVNKHNIIYNELYKYSQDYEFIRELMRIGKLHNLSQELLLYRQSDTQISKSKFGEQHKLANGTRLKYIIEAAKLRYTVPPDDSTDVKLVFHDLKKMQKGGLGKIVDNSILSLLFNFNSCFAPSFYLGEILSLDHAFRDKLKLIKSALK